MIHDLIRFVIWWLIKLMSYTIWFDWWLIKLIWYTIWFDDDLMIDQIYVIHYMIWWSDRSNAVHEQHDVAVALAGAPRALLRRVRHRIRSALPTWFDSISSFSRLLNFGPWFFNTIFFWANLSQLPPTRFKLSTLC